MADTGLVAQYEQTIIAYLEDYIEGNSVEDLHRGSGAEWDLWRLHERIRGKDRRQAFLEALENVIRSEDTSEIVKMIAIEMSEDKGLWEVEEAVLELSERVPPMVGTYVPGTWGQLSSLARLRVVIDSFLASHTQ